MKNAIIFGIILCSFNGGFAQDNSISQLTAQVYTAHPNMIKAGLQDIENEDVRSKSISKTFAADRTDKINLSNQFGSMLIKVWDRKEVKIDVGITVKSNNAKEAQKLIDEVSISTNKSGDLISCKTNIDKGSKSGNRNRHGEIKVNYVVYVPSNNSLTISQQFGNVNIGDFSGALSANLQYGNFDAGNLSGSSNFISVQYGKTNIAEINAATIKQQYGSGLTIGIAGTLDLDAQYVTVNINTIKGDAIIRQQYGAGVTIGLVYNLNLDAQYANVNIGDIKGSATVKQQYNSLKIGTVGKLSIHSEYTGVTIGTLKGDGNFKMSYNDLNIDGINQTCKNLVIDAQYVDASLKFAHGYNGNFKVRKSYGSFNSGAYPKTGTGEDSGSTKNYIGKIGNGGNTVNIKSVYGSVTLR